MRVYHTFLMLVAGVMLATVCIATDTFAANLISNGSFEQPPVPPGLNVITPIDWTVSDSVYLVRGNSGQYPPPMPFPDGDQCLGVINDDTSISQTFTLVSTTTLNLTYWDAYEIGGLNLPSVLDSVATITDLSSNVVITSPTYYADANNETWKLNSWSIGDLPAGSYKLSLSLGGSIVCDNVILTSVPEPSTVILLGMGSISTIFIWQRRKV